jgi:DNA repair exonuclease SbcCD ATPase subunit
MSDISDNTTDISSTDDSGIQISTENVKHEAQLSCSDVLAELLQIHKRMREAETQVRSLSLILEHADAGIDHSVFEENKTSLEQEIVKIKEEICDKELLLQQSDETLFEYYLGSVKDESKLPKLDLSIKHIDNNKLTQSDLCENQEMDGCEDNINGSECLKNDNQRWDAENSLAKEEEIAALRRSLAESRQKHKEERDKIMKQLKALQITTVQDEMNWKCVLKSKQLTIDQLSGKISELETKHGNVSSNEKKKQEKQQKKKKDEKIILSLRAQNSSMNEEMKQLSGEVKELRNSEENLNESLEQMTARNRKLEHDLSDKLQMVDEKNRAVEEYSKEIKETNNLVNKLVMEVNCLNADHESLKKQLKDVTTEDYKKKLKYENAIAEKGCSVHVAEGSAFQLNNAELERMKEELDVKQRNHLHLTAKLEKQQRFVERFKENEIKLHTESEMWKSRSLQNERREDFIDEIFS